MELNVPSCGWKCQLSQEWFWLKFSSQLFAKSQNQVSWPLIRGVQCTQNSLKLWLSDTFHSRLSYCLFILQIFPPSFHFPRPSHKTSHGKAPTKRERTFLQSHKNHKLGLFYASPGDLCRTFLKNHVLSNECFYCATSYLGLGKNEDCLTIISV